MGRIIIKQNFRAFLSTILDLFTCRCLRWEYAEYAEYAEYTEYAEYAEYSGKDMSLSCCFSLNYKLPKSDPSVVY